MLWGVQHGVTLMYWDQGGTLYHPKGLEEGLYLLEVQGVVGHPPVDLVVVVAEWPLCV